ncbi:MAG: DUF5681 domain-containing protein [Hyphomonadaceae bacterium]
MAKKLSEGAPEGQPDQDEAVGYCRPPKHTRFKPGQSGNPRGRPRKKLALNDILEEAATTLVQVTVDGRVRRMPALKAIMMLEVRKALQGDGKASRFVLDTFEARGLGGPASGSQDDLASQAAGARERLAQKVEAALKNANSLTPNQPTASERTG